MGEASAFEVEVDETVGDEGQGVEEAGEGGVGVEEFGEVERAVEEAVVEESGVERGRGGGNVGEESEGFREAVLVAEEKDGLGEVVVFA